MRRHSFTPQGLTYDKGFTAESFQELCHALETQTRVVWPHHHQANAPLERCNRTLQGGIKAIIAGWNVAMAEPALPYWHVASEFCTAAFNNHPGQELGGVSPVFAELGRPPVPIAQATHPALHALPSDPLPDAIMRHHLALATRDAIATALHESAALRALSRNRNRRYWTPKTGDIVSAAIPREDNRAPKFLLSLIHI